jgi:archaellum biogenesis protein FlaJ (TadC family)
VKTVLLGRKAKYHTPHLEDEMTKTEITESLMLSHIYVIAFIIVGILIGGVFQKEVSYWFFVAAVLWLGNVVLGLVYLEWKK